MFSDWLAHGNLSVTCLLRADAQSKESECISMGCSVCTVVFNCREALPFANELNAMKSSAVLKTSVLEGSLDYSMWPEEGLK